MKKVIRANKSLGSDISDYQKWVDFDMKKYGKISDITMKDIKKAGLSVVKDQYGDYEVIADDKVEGGCQGKKKVTASEDFTLKDTVHNILDKIGAVNRDLTSLMIRLYQSNDINNAMYSAFLNVAQDSENLWEKLSSEFGNYYKELNKIRGFNLHETIY